MKRAKMAGIGAMVLLGSAATAFFLRPKPAGSEVKTSAPAPSAAAPAGSLLDEIAPKDAAEKNSKPGVVPTNEQLEKQIATIHENQEQVNELKVRSTQAMEARDGEQVKALADVGRRQVALLNLRLSALQADLDAARQARPKDPTIEWLTGELLLIAGGEPEEIRPHFERAVAAGLKSPELYTSMAAVELDSNHFDAAYEDAEKGLASQSESAWEMYLRASFAKERFRECAAAIDRAFPTAKPPWAVSMRDRAATLANQWRHELALRAAEDKRNNLPMVRLTIEHRAFAGPAEKATGRGEVEIALLPEQEPSAVANFLKRVEQKLYDGTRFDWAEGGRMAAAGDAAGKVGDAIHGASQRSHFRGSVSMLGPSQFAILVAPAPEWDGRFPVFGRVVAGQEVVDQITIGRINRDAGEFGRIIPGDVIVRAEVVRK